MYGQPPGGGGYGGPPPAGGYGGGPPPQAPPPQYIPMAPAYGMPPNFGPRQPGFSPGGAPPKSKFVTILLCMLPSMIGVFGVHRFYTGHIGIGIAQFFTFGGCGIWQLVDLIFIFTGKYTDKNGQALVADHPVRKLM